MLPRHPHPTQSQRLKTALSTVGRLLASDYALYVLGDEQGRALAFIKLGRKCLYVTVSLRTHESSFVPSHQPYPITENATHTYTFTHRTLAG